MQSAFDGIYEIEEKKITTAVAVAACTLWLCRQDGHFVGAIDKDKKADNKRALETVVQRRLNGSDTL